MRERALFLISLLLALPAACAMADSGASKEAEMRYAAEIRWTTDEPSTSQAEYGTDPQNYSNSTPLNNALVTDHRAILTGLKPATVYHYRVKSRNQSGEETVSEDFTVSVVAPGERPKMRITGVETGNIIATGHVAAPKEEKREAEKAEGAGKGVAPKKSMIIEEAPIQETLIERNALLLPPGKFQVEPSLTYAHASSNKITVRGFSILPILVIGEISTESVKRDIFIPALTLRGGIWKNLQGEFMIPTRFQYNRVSNQFGQDETTSTGGLGDIEGSLYYQLLYEKGAMPGLIAGFTAKSDTGRSPYGTLTGLGTGHWGLKTGLTAVKSADPVILFGGVNYAWNIKRDISGFGDVDPGDTVSYNLGAAIALNYQTAMNFQVEQDITGSVVMNGNTVPGSFTNNAIFKIGLIYSISKDLAVDVSGGIGLTEDSPDFTMELRVPYTF